MAKRQSIPARKREAKHRRARADELRRRQQRRERRRTAVTIGVAVLLGVGLVGGVAYARWAPTRIGYSTGASGAAQQAGCTGVRNDASAGSSHTPKAVKYATIPPSSGEHNGDPLPDLPQFYDRATVKRVPLLAERAVHGLEHGFVIGWYDPALPQVEVAKLQAIAPANARFIAVPWTAGTFPDGRHFVLTAWDRTQRCKTVSAQVVSSFTTTYANSKSAPEPGGSGGSSIAPPAPSPRPSPSPSPRK